MSGGSHDYIFCKIDQYLSGGEFRDEQVDGMVEDFIKLTKALEWWQSGDKGEEDYREVLMQFKDKWLRG